MVSLYLLLNLNLNLNLSLFFQNYCSPYVQCVHVLLTNHSPAAQDQNHPLYLAKFEQQTAGLSRASLIAH